MSITTDTVITAGISLIVVAGTIFNTYLQMQTKRAVLELQVWILQTFVTKTDCNARHNGNHVNE